MVISTFMLGLALHGMHYIHGVMNIICDLVHSCIALHYMNGTTFMG